MPLPEERAWFAAKKYSWGWGFPTRWPGWVVLTVYIIAIHAGIFLAFEHTGYSLLYVFGLTAALLGICWWKGAPTRWHRGEDRDRSSRG